MSYFYDFWIYKKTKRLLGKLNKIVLLFLGTKYVQKSLILMIEKNNLFPVEKELNLKIQKVKQYLFLVFQKGLDLKEGKI